MNVAYIPVRGGSKSIPMKNIKMIADNPLVWWVVSAACSCEYIDKVYVSTDSEEIRKVVVGFNLPKVEVVGRSPESATDTASTESAMLEFAFDHDFTNIALIQATSPLLCADDLSKGFSLLENNEADSVLSVVRQHRFIWNENADGGAEPVNYDYKNRPRRQDFEGFIVENGAFYITSREALLGTRSRISGKIKTVMMSPESYFEIDEPEDWQIVETMLQRRTKKSKIKTPEIKMFLCDCDGTLTDGGMYYSAKGEELKKFNTRDAFGLRLLKEHGIITGIITSENTEIVIRRGKKMNVDEIIINSRNKLEDITNLCEKYNIDIKNIAYIGDDLNDLDVISNVGLSFCPADACEAVKKAAHYKTDAKGGAGAVREAAEHILCCRADPNVS